MFKKLGLMIIVVLMMTIALVACGDEAAVVPTYSGASTVTLPDSLKTQMETSMGANVKNAKIEAFKTSDDAAKVKTSLADGFKKNGWDDKSKDLGDTTTQMDSIGAFAMLYQKGTSAAGVIGFPGAIAGAMGFAGATDKDTVYIIASGTSK
ncbi:hypothetical protein [Candidatus Chlorohelix sp.]|uniref:hypothetical protein n=1 Tax=Candidatus Chlorohelix sp. TaxID=3139201 RepID=UPI0030686493